MATRRGRRAPEPAPTPPRRRNGLVASAAPVNLATKGAAKLIEARRQPWQEEAWAALDGVAEIGHTLDYRANVISKVQLFAAVKPDNRDEAPVPVEVAAADRLITDAVATLAGQVVDAFDRGDGLASLLHKTSLNLDVAGDLHVVGEGEGDAETWNAYSDRELTEKSGATMVPDAETGKSRPLGPSLSFRLWTRHPRESRLARSSLMPLVIEGLVEELLLISMEMRAGSKSRIPKGLLAIADEVVMGMSASDATARADVDEGEGAGTLIDDLIAWGTGAMDPGSTASFFPGLVRVPIDQIENWAKFIELGKPIDPLAIERARYVVDRIANGLNMPKEIVLGFGDTNHWGAAIIERAGFRAYMEPSVLAIVHGFTVGALRPRLLASGVDPSVVDRLVVWYDEKDAIAPENRVETATKGVELNALGREAWRREAKFDEEDAPSDDELVRYTGLDRGILTAEVTMALLKLAGLVPESIVLPGAGPAEPAPIELPPAPDTPDPTEPPDDTPPAPEVEPAALVAAGATDVGERLAAIDRRLFDRVSVAADAAVERAVERADNRLRSLARKDPRAKAQLAAAVAAGPALGRPWAVRLAAGDDESEDDTVAGLVAGAFGGLATKVSGWIAAAQAATVAEVAALAPGELSEAETAQVVAEQGEDRERAVTWLVAALSALAVRVLFGDVEADGPGEVDPTVTVPAGIVREALAVAGGAVNVERTVVGGITVDGRPVGAVATGERSRTLFARVKAWWSGYRWEYGDASTRQRPFPPHQALGGKVFARWDSAELANDSAPWLPTTTLSPGDHRGCRCDWTPVVLAPPAEEVAA